MSAGESLYRMMGGLERKAPNSIDPRLEEDGPVKFGRKPYFKGARSGKEARMSEKKHASTISRKRPPK